jgi:4-hydroxy-L-threonine phosphate dehydrogenase PdxA
MRFVGYDTTTSGALTAGFLPLTASGTWTSPQLQTDVAQNITGSAYSDQPGILTVQQSFNGGVNWDISQSFPITAASGTAFSVNVSAPISQIYYVNNTSTAQTVMRVYARSVEFGWT